MAIWDIVQRPTLFNEASDREVWLVHHQWSGELHFVELFLIV